MWCESLIVLDPYDSFYNQNIVYCHLKKSIIKRVLDYIFCPHSSIG